MYNLGIDSDVENGYKSLIKTALGLVLVRLKLD
jgi:hypothetical protein